MTSETNTSTPYAYAGNTNEPCQLYDTVIIRGIVSRPELNGLRGMVMGLPNQTNRIDRFQVTINHYSPPLYPTKGLEPITINLKQRNIRTTSYILPYPSGHLARGGKYHIGSTELSFDMLPIVMERYRLELNKKSFQRTVQDPDGPVVQKRWQGMGCSVCGAGGMSDPLADQCPSVKLFSCAGCDLCQYCSQACEDADKAAGHDKVCLQLHTLYSICSMPALRAGGEMKLGTRVYTGVPKKMTLGIKKKMDESAMIELCEQCVRQCEGMYRQRNDPVGLAACQKGDLLTLFVVLCEYPAYAELGTNVGVKTSLKAGIAKGDSFMSDEHAFYFQGKLGKYSLCAQSHQKKLNEAKKVGKGLKTKIELPCGKNPMAGKNSGCRVAMQSACAHEPVFTTLKKLTLAKEQKRHCHPCNSRQSSIVISNCFYSFCLERAVNSVGDPGSISHCPYCGVCRNYMFGHCSQCNTCSYGGKHKFIPCSECHDMVLHFDGLAHMNRSQFDCPYETYKLSSMGKAMAPCHCNNETTIFCGPLSSPLHHARRKGKATKRKIPSTHRRLHFLQGFGKYQNKNNNFTEEFDSVVEDGKSMYRQKYISDPTFRMSALDTMIRDLHIKAGKGTGMFSEMGEATMRSGAAHVKDADHLSRMREQMHDEMHGPMAEAVAKHHRKLISKNATLKKMNELDRLIYWRKEAEEEATKELEDCKKKGMCIDKEKYEYLLVRKCASCALAATATIRLLKCACQLVYFCGTDCQREYWGVHKKVCKAARSLGKKKKKEKKKEK